MMCAANDQHRMLQLLAETDTTVAGENRGTERLMAAVCRKTCMFVCGAGTDNVVLCVPIDGTVPFMSESDVRNAAAELLRHDEADNLNLAVRWPGLFWNIVWYGGGVDGVRAVRGNVKQLVKRLAPLMALATDAIDTEHLRHGGSGRCRRGT